MALPLMKKGILYKLNLHLLKKEEDRSGYEQFQDYGPRVKVYHFGGSSWISRIIMIIVLVAILAAIVFFGGIILSIVGVVILVGAIISFILGLFYGIIYLLRQDGGKSIR